MCGGRLPCKKSKHVMWTPSARAPCIQIFFARSCLYNQQPHEYCTCCALRYEADLSRLGMLCGGDRYLAGTCRAPHVATPQKPYDHTPPRSEWTKRDRKNVAVRLVMQQRVASYAPDTGVFDLRRSRICSRILANSRDMHGSTAVDNDK